MPGWMDVLMGVLGVGMILFFRRDKLPHMVQRSGTAVGLLLVAVTLVIFRESVFPFIYLLTAISAQWEMIKALKSGGCRPMTWVNLAFIVLLYPAWLYGNFYGTILLYGLAGFAILLVYACRRERTLSDAMASVFALLYPGVGFLYLVLLNGMQPERLATFGFAAAILVPEVGDIFAFLTGKYLGKTPLVPHISPNKTVEGAVGGLLGGVLTMLLVGLTARLWGITWPLWQYLVSGLVIDAFGQVGDLVASGIKRATGIKDFSHCLGSHGGVLDRMDSILTGAMAAYLWMVIFA